MNVMHPHLYFRNAANPPVEFRQKTRYAGISEDEDVDNEMEVDYTPMREDFLRSITSFFRDREQRSQERNIALRIPAHVDFIEITFHNVFDSSKFNNRYRINFGLSAVRYREFNTKGLFAIVDQNAFRTFLEQIDGFVNNPNRNLNNNDIKFIKEFELLSTDKIINFQEYKDHVILDLVDSIEIFQSHLLPIQRALKEYLEVRSISFIEDSNGYKIELLGAPEDVVQEIARNFDNIQAINSHSAGVVRPGAFNILERSHGFTISNANDELPIIGIIDTGISDETPIAGLIINDGNEFDLTNTSVRVDRANHGTAVATLAALGKQLYPEHRGEFIANAKLLSIKTLSGSNGILAETSVINAIREAHLKYGIKIFTLTIAYTDPKKYNSIVSDYAFALDLLTNELNILVFIAIGNNLDLSYMDGNISFVRPYPDIFKSESTTLFSPAESFNNITIGAVSGNLENNDEHCISPNGSHPAMYTRKFHINWIHSSLNTKRKNKMLFKPDVCSFGGEYDSNLRVNATGLKVISTRTGHYFEREVGTSYATPLVANLAAKLIKRYPELENNMQTVKALIVNSAKVELLHESISDLDDVHQTALIGNGVPDDYGCLNSDDNQVTLILEDSIRPETIKSYPLELPAYLLDRDRKNGIINIVATICFKFHPIKDNHLAYCPIHIAFGIFKDIELQSYDEKGNPTDLGINGNKVENYKVKGSWSQDYYFKPKMLSNCQKVKYSFSKQNLIDEQCKLKIAVNSKFHKLLDEEQKNSLNRVHQFSIVLTIQESPVRNENSNQLYAELCGVNNLVALNDLDNILEAEA